MATFVAELDTTITKARSVVSLVEFADSLERAKQAMVEAEQFVGV